MAEQLDPSTFTGAHPTTSQFVDQLQMWGFTRRRTQGVHLVFRGPHGGTVRVLRSQLGRADPALVAKAARLADVEPAQFWAGPDTTAEPTVAEADPDAATAGDTMGADVATDISETESRDQAPRTVRSARLEPSARRRPSRDQITSLVLAAHTSTDRPLGFDQVVQFCHGRITRDQVRTASATLCRDGHLDRIRTAVYQWSGGRRATIVPPAAAVLAEPIAAPARSIVPRSRPAVVKAPTAAELFEQLFPAGVQMTAELLRDFEQWAELTAKLTAHSAGASQAS